MAILELSQLEFVCEVCCRIGGGSWEEDAIAMGCEEQSDITWDISKQFSTYPQNQLLLQNNDHCTSSSPSPDGGAPLHQVEKRNTTYFNKSSNWLSKMNYSHEEQYRGKKNNVRPERSQTRRKKKKCIYFAGLDDAVDETPDGGGLRSGPAGQSGGSISQASAYVMGH